MPHWCPTKPNFVKQGSGKRVGNDQKLTLGQLSPWVLCSTSLLTQGLEKQLFFFFLKRVYLAQSESVQKALKKEAEIYYTSGQK